MKSLSIIAVSIFHLLNFAAASHLRDERGLFDPLVSAVDSVLGISTAENTQAAATTVVQTTLSTAAQTTTEPQPTTVTASIAEQTTSQSPSSTTTSATNNSQPTALSLISASSTTAVSSSTSSVHATLTSTPVPTTSIPSNPLQGLPSSSPAPSQPEADAGNHVTTAGIVVAIVFGIVILAGIAYLILKFNPAVNTKYTRWQESRRKARTYRAGFNSDEEHGHEIDFYKAARSREPTTSTLPRKHLELRHQRDSQETLVSTKSPGSPDALEKPQRFSFQFFTSPRIHQFASSVRRKPVPSPSRQSYRAYRPQSELFIGLAVPMGSESKELPPLPR